MTTIDFIKAKDGFYKEFTCFGHAEFAKNNEADILCASISVLVINTINCLEELAKEDISVSTNEETGFIRCIIHGELKQESVFLLDSLVYGLRNISKEYGEKYLKVRIKEV